MRASELQKNLFKKVIEYTGEQKAVEQIGQLLGISRSSVYNRVNGTQMLRLDELLAIGEQFQLRLNQFFPDPGDTAVFTLPTFSSPIRTSQEFLSRMLQNVERVARVPDVRIWFTTYEVPVFHYMNFRELALFKLFAWGRINWRLPYLENLVFVPDEFPEAFVYEKYMRPILEHYTSIPTVEFWTDSIYDVVLRQLRYFEIAGQIKKDVSGIIRNQLLQLCQHQYQMAEKGKKWIFGNEETTENQSAMFDLYNNEISSTNITLLIESPQTKGVFTVLDNPNFMHSFDLKMYDYNYDWMSNLRNKCIHISLDAEQARRNYFSILQEKIEKI